MRGVEHFAFSTWILGPYSVFEAKWLSLLIEISFESTLLGHFHSNEIVRPRKHPGGSFTWSGASRASRSTMNGPLIPSFA